MAFPRRFVRLVLLTALAFAAVLVFHFVPLTASPPSLLPSLAESASSAGKDSAPAREFHPPLSIKPLPTEIAKSLPRVQAPANEFKPSRRTEERRDAVRKAFKRSYDAYKEHAWLHDELRPVTGGFRDPFGGWAATLIDSLDTLWIMGFKDEFAEASAAVLTLDWHKTSHDALNLFETTIRHLAGLLSAYELSADPALLYKAKELGELLYRAFDTPNRMPGFWLNFQSARNGAQVAGNNNPSAASTSLCLEFTRLSQLTGDPKFYDATDRVTRMLEKTQQNTRLPGMWPISMDFRNKQALASRFTLGALADSLYEYFPKMHALLGGVDDVYERMYRTAIETAATHLLFRPMLPDKKDILFTGDWDANAEEKLIPESQHLTCFVGGMFALGGRLFNIPEHVSLGERLAHGCAWAYQSFPTGVMPEIFGLIPCKSLKACAWDEKLWHEKGAQNLPKGFINARDPKYQLRPEAIESLFILYRITGKAELQDLAWEMFEAITRSTQTELAYSSIADVTVSGPTRKEDAMESFWMAETLKYFYLIFSPPDVISLDEWVLNTEAHPLRRALAPDATPRHA